MNRLIVPTLAALLLTGLAGSAHAQYGYPYQPAAYGQVYPQAGSPMLMPAPAQPMVVPMYAPPYIIQQIPMFGPVEMVQPGGPLIPEPVAMSVPVPALPPVQAPVSPAPAVVPTSATNRVVPQVAAPAAGKPAVTTGKHVGKPWYKKAWEWFDDL